jgi:enoyl-[acyl-carrier protein] reductase II
MKKKITDLFGIKYPIIQGVTWGKHVQLAAAVSNAGGLGVLHGRMVFREGKEVGNPNVAIDKMRSLTSKPFSINIPITIVTKEMAAELVRLAIEQRVAVVTTSAGDPTLYTERFQRVGIKVIHVVATVKHALKAAEAGVDAVVASGVEAGGWVSHEETTTFTLIPQVADAVGDKIPVIAAGGIGDARGIMAAFSLGADGVQLGTRFMASAESGLEPDYLNTILKANDACTEVIGRGHRPARNFTEEYLQVVRPGYKRPQIGPLDAGGQVSGLIKDVPSVEVIMQRLIGGLEAEFTRVNRELATYLK